MMKLRTKFVLFVVILHVLVLVLAYFVLRQHPLLFIASEVFIIISVILAWQLYKQLIKPLRLLTEGAEALKDREFNIRFTPTGQYEMDLLIQVYNRMTDELRNERIKQEQQHLFLKKLIDTSPTGIIILDYDGRIHDINPGALRLLGISRSIATSAPESASHPVLQLVRELKSGTSRSVTLNGVSTYKLQKSHFIDQGFVRHFVMVEELTADILAAEKKAYGKVIRMMAHEVNNTIGAVNSIIQSALRTSCIWEDKQHLPLQQALHMAYDRNSNLTVFMRNFADVVRIPEPQPSLVDLHLLIHTIGQFMETKATEKDITLHYELDPRPFQLMADARQLEHVLINIVKNAIEAINEPSGGHITFHTDTVTRRLTITDNGRGISPQHAEQLFSPFFSTKPNGQGIGLTLVKEILINHGAAFSLQTSSPGHTTFELRFAE